MPMILKVYLFFLIIAIVCFSVVYIEIRGKIKKYYPEFSEWAKHNKPKYTITEHIVSAFRTIFPFLVPVYRMVFVIAILSESIFKEIVEKSVYRILDNYKYEYKYVNLWK